jgi:hypothetical protein
LAAGPRGSGFEVRHKDTEVYFKIAYNENVDDMKSITLRTCERLFRKFSLEIYSFSKWTSQQYCCGHGGGTKGISEWGTVVVV